MESAVKQSAGSGLYTIVSKKKKKKKKKIWRSRSRSYLSYPCRLPKFEIVPHLLLPVWLFDYYWHVVDGWLESCCDPTDSNIQGRSAERANQIQELIHPSLFLIFLFISTRIVAICLFRININIAWPAVVVDVRTEMQGTRTLASKNKIQQLDRQTYTEHETNKRI